MGVAVASGALATEQDVAHGENGHAVQDGAFTILNALPGAGAVKVLTKLDDAAQLLKGAQQLRGADDAAEVPASFGWNESTEYRATFFAANPTLRGNVVVHHAVEQAVLKRYPGVVTPQEMHSLENLRGIPAVDNPVLHLSQIRTSWNAFYKMNPAPTREDLLAKATEIDGMYGSQFAPPVR